MSWFPSLCFRHQFQRVPALRIGGCPGAFVDFFYLTTAGDGVGDDNPTAEELEVGPRFTSWTHSL
jgi:hypothetical protein